MAPERRNSIIACVNVIIDLSCGFYRLERLLYFIRKEKSNSSIWIFARPWMCSEYNLIKIPILSLHVHPLPRRTEVMLVWVMEVEVSWWRVQLDRAKKCFAHGTGRIYLNISCGCLMSEWLGYMGILFQPMGASEMCCLGTRSDRFWSIPSKYSLQFTVYSCSCSCKWDMTPVNPT